MPTTSWQIAHSEIQRPFGFEAFLTTTNITTDDKVISTRLGDRWNQDDFFNGWYLIIRGAGNNETMRRVEDYVGSTGSCTVAGANLSTESGPITCEVSRFHPDDVKRAFNRARQDAFPQIGIFRDRAEAWTSGHRQYTLNLTSPMRKVYQVFRDNRDSAASLSENLFTDGGLEDWTSATALRNWTLAGSGASVHQEEATSSPTNFGVFEGSNSARLVVPVDTLTTLLQTVTPSVATEGVEVNVSAWVFTEVPGRVSVRIEGNDGTAHGGGGWEKLFHTLNLTATFTNASAGIAASSGAAMAFFVDEFVISFGQPGHLEREWTPIYGWHYLPPEDGATAGKLEFREPLPPKVRIRVVGSDLLSSVSTDADTIEIDGELLAPLYDLTRAYLCEERITIKAGQSTQIYWERQRSKWMGSYEDRINNGQRLKYPKVMLPTAYGSS
jgi:hypothetical protein